MAMKVVKEAIKSEKPSMGVPDTKAFLVDTLTSANPEKKQLRADFSGWKSPSRFPIPIRTMK